MAYLIIKLFHVLFVVIFLGNITIGLFWKMFAEKTKDPDKIAFAFKGIIKADRYFTVPGVIGITLFGIAGAMHGRIPILGTGWILWSIILLIISGVAFMAKLVPLQKKLAALASDKERFNWDEYHKLSKRWDIWGYVALLTPWIAVILMVIKPNI
jgi:uncharacterized membrane protein